MIQTNEEIVKAIQDRFDEVVSIYEDMSDAVFLYQPPNKWTTGQHLEHLIIASKPVLLAIKLPKFALKYKFGLTNRSSRTYDYVLNKYKTGLAAGYKAPNSVEPAKRSPADKTRMLKDFSTLGKKITHVAAKWSEKDLDKYILPHPAMGKMPVREILFFTEFHTQHHINIIKEKYINE